MTESTDLKVLVAQVAAAYFANTHVNAADIATVIGQIASSLEAVGADNTAALVADEPPIEQVKKPTPAQIKKSISDEGLTSFEDGKSYKTLKRHLSIRGMSPDEYRTKWGLPADYPLTAPAYSARRSALAKQLGLGNKRK